MRHWITSFQLLTTTQLKPKIVSIQGLPAGAQRLGARAAAAAAVRFPPAATSVYPGEARARRRSDGMRRRANHGAIAPMKISLPVVILGTQFLVPVNEQVPVLDVSASCRAAATAGMAADESYRSCMSDEQSARSNCSAAGPRLRRAIAAGAPPRPRATDCRATSNCWCVCRCRVTRPGCRRRRCRAPGRKNKHQSPRRTRYARAGRGPETNSTGRRRSDDGHHAPRHRAPRNGGGGLCPFDGFDEALAASAAVRDLLCSAGRDRVGFDPDKPHFRSAPRALRPADERRVRLGVKPGGGAFEGRGRNVCHGYLPFATMLRPRASVER